MPGQTSLTICIIYYVATKIKSKFYLPTPPPKNQEGIRGLLLFSATIFYIAECLSPIFHGIIKALQNHSHIHVRPTLKGFRRVCFGFIFFPPMEYGLVIIFPSAVIVFAVNGHSFDKQFSQFFNYGFSIFDLLLIVFAITTHLLPPNQ